MAVYQEWKRQRRKKTCKLKIVSHNTIQGLFQFFFEELIRLDLVWKIVIEVYGEFVLTLKNPIKQTLLHNFRCN